MEQLQQLGQEGFRFRPTDSEGLMFLLRFVARQEMHNSGFITTNVDVYGKQEPWEIYDNGVPCGDDDNNSSYRYFITKLKKKSNTRYNRSVGNKGTWKQDNKGKPVHYKNMGSSSSVVNIGSKMSLSYKNKKFYPEDQKDGHWLMKEYELSNVILHKFDEERRDYVLCAIKKLKHVNSSSETSTITTLNNISEGTDEVTSSVDDLLATNNCKGCYNMCKNLEQSETLAFQESMVLNNNVFEPLQLVAEPAEVHDYLYQWDGQGLDKLNQILDGALEVDVAVGIVEPLTAATEPTEAAYNCGKHSVEATARYDPSMPDTSINSAHIEYSKMANMSQMNLISFDQSVPEDVLGLDPWDIMGSDELNPMLEDVSESCPDGC